MGSGTSGALDAPPSLLTTVVGAEVPSCVSAGCCGGAAGAGGALAVLTGLLAVAGGPVPGHGGVVTLDGSCSPVRRQVWALPGEGVATDRSGVPGLGGAIAAVGECVEGIGDLVEVVSDVVDVVGEVSALRVGVSGCQRGLKLVGPPAQTVPILQQRRPGQLLAGPAVADALGLIGRLGLGVRPIQGGRRRTRRRLALVHPIVPVFAHAGHGRRDLPDRCYRPGPARAGTAQVPFVMPAGGRGQADRGISDLRTGALAAARAAGVADVEAWAFEAI